MDRWFTMRVFTRVARLGSFSAAARELRLSTTSVSRQVAQLEDHLQARLLERTTRQQRLTEIGGFYLDRCERLLGDLEELEGEILEGEARVRGHLRVAAGVDLGRAHLARHLPEFLDRHPDVEVELVLSDAFVDLVAEGFDLAIRAGTLDDSSMIARLLARTRLVAVASPAYLERRGRPTAPAQLAEHDALFDTNLRSRHWRFDTPDGEVRVRPRARAAVNSPAATRAFALADHGVVVIPEFLVRDDLERGALAVLFEDLPTRWIPVQAVHTRREYQSARARAYADFCATTFAASSAWR